MKIHQNLAHPNNYTNGRTARVDHITLHHAATTDFDGIARTFQNPNRKASATYGVGKGIIHQYVSEKDTAWADGNWDSNCSGISIEHVNESGAPNWNISDEVIRTSAELCADIAKRHWLGELKIGSTVRFHSDFSKTQCPAQIRDGGLGQRICDLANEINRENNPTQQPAIDYNGDIEELAWAVIRGEYGNGEERKNRLGANYQAVQAKVNELLSVNNQPNINLEVLADEVIRGVYGNGEERKNRLGANYQAVQNIVNRKLGV